MRNNFKSGSYHLRKSRYEAVDRFINALGAVRQVPPKWHALSQANIQCVVEYWKQSNLRESTISIYISQLRCFLKTINHSIERIDNTSLGISKSSKPIAYTCNDQNFESIYDPLIQQLFLLQTEFGLSYSETMRFIPDIHSKEDCLWLTREITRNSLDRIIPIVNEKQNEIIRSLLSQLNNCESAKSQFGYDEVRMRYRLGLRSIGLTTSISYRFIYAKKRYQFLLNTMCKKNAQEKIIHEMGISKVTLRRYLHEQN